MASKKKAKQPTRLDVLTKGFEGYCEGYKAATNTVVETAYSMKDESFTANQVVVEILGALAKDIQEVGKDLEAVKAKMLAKAKGAGK